MKMYYPFIGTVIVTLFLGFGCKNEKNQTQIDMADSTDMAITDKNTIYRLPSPVDMYMLMFDNQNQFDKTLINNPVRISDYYTKFSKMVNFGIYASDLSYCTVFNQNQESFQYFKTAKTLADELGYTEGFNEVLIKRIEQSQYHLDTLYQVSMDAYWDACTFLEDQGKTDELTIILAGGWIESLYIAFSSVKKFDPADIVVSRLAEQDLLLDNLLSMFKSFERDEQAQKLYARLSDLKDAYAQIGGGTFTVDQFEALKQKITMFRNELTK